MSKRKSSTSEYQSKYARSDTTQYGILRLDTKGKNRFWLIPSSAIHGEEDISIFVGCYNVGGCGDTDISVAQLEWCTTKSLPMATNDLLKYIRFYTVFSLKDDGDTDDYEPNSAPDEVYEEQLWMFPDRDYGKWAGYEVVPFPNDISGIGIELMITYVVNSTADWSFTPICGPLPVLSRFTQNYVAVQRVCTSGGVQDTNIWLIPENHFDDGFADTLSYNNILSNLTDPKSIAYMEWRLYELENWFVSFDRSYNFSQMVSYLGDMGVRITLEDRNQFKREFESKFNEYERGVWSSYLFKRDKLKYISLLNIKMPNGCRISRIIRFESGRSPQDLLLHSAETDDLLDLYNSELPSD